MRRRNTANESRCNFYAQSTVSLATALNPYIGYAKAAEIVKESVATGRSIIDIARDKKLLSEKEISEILDPVRMTEPQYPLEPRKNARKKQRASRGLTQMNAELCTNRGYPQHPCNPWHRVCL